MNDIEQVYHYMLGMVQTMAATAKAGMELPAVENAPNSNPGEFRKLLEQRQQQPPGGAEKEEPAAEATAPAEETAPADVQDMPEDQQVLSGEALVQAQVMWTAMSIQHPAAVQAAQPQLETAAAAQSASTVVEIAAAAPKTAAAVQMAQPQMQLQPQGEVQMQSQLQPQTHPPGQVKSQLQQSIAATPEQSQTAQTAAQAQPGGAEQTAKALLQQTAQQSQAAAGQTTQRQAAVTEHAAAVETGLEEAEGMSKPLFRELDSLPVKVGETEGKPEAGQPKEITQQVAGKLADALKNGDTQVRIQLEPANLGSVQVELTRSADGTLRVLLSADNAKTRGLLERTAGTLQSLLVSSGSQNVQVEVQRQEESQRQDLYDEQGHGGRQDREQEQRRQRRSEEEEQDFLQQLRLGLIPLEARAV